MWRIPTLGLRNLQRPKGVEMPWLARAGPRQGRPSRRGKEMDAPHQGDETFPCRVPLSGLLVVQAEAGCWGMGEVSAGMEAKPDAFWIPGREEG